MTTPTKANISLSPSGELLFVNASKASVEVKLDITNLSLSETVHFKVKTTAPWRYCVRPNQGKIAPSSTTEVSVLLQQLAVEDIRQDKTDKFLVQAVNAEGDRDTKEVFSDVAKENINVTEVRLNCRFIDEAASQGGEGEGVAQGGTAVKGEEAPVTSSEREKSYIDKLKLENAQLTAQNNKYKEEYVELKKHINHRLLTTSNAQRANSSLVARHDMLPLMLATLVLGIILGAYF